MKSRLQQNAEVIGTDERFFDDETQSQLLDLYHERAGILDESDEGEVDLATTHKFPAAFMRHEVEELRDFPHRDSLQIGVELVPASAPTACR